MTALPCPRFHLRSAAAALLALSCLTSTAADTRPAASAPAAAGQDLRDFVARRQQCDHFRGEEATNAKRQAELDAQLQKFCKGTDAQLPALKKKYQGDKAASKTLAGFDANIE